MNKVAIFTPYIKLDSFLKLCGACVTGGQSKIMIASGDILVDGQLCLMRGKKLYPGAVVTAGDQVFQVVADS